MPSCKWQIGEIASWQNINLIKGLFEKMQIEQNESRENVKLMKWPSTTTSICKITILTMASWENGKLTKWHVVKMPSWQNAKLQNGLLEKLQVDKHTFDKKANCKVENWKTCQVDKMPSWIKWQVE